MATGSSGLNFFDFKLPSSEVAELPPRKVSGEPKRPEGHGGVNSSVELLRRDSTNWVGENQGKPSKGSTVGEGEAFLSYYSLSYYMIIDASWKTQQIKAFQPNEALCP